MSTTNGGPQPQMAMPQVGVLVQYLKDFSFENPHAPRSLAPSATPVLSYFAGLAAAEGDFIAALKLAAATVGLRQGLGGRILPSDRVLLEQRLQPAYAALDTWLGGLPPDLLDHRRREAELIFRRIGITFAVYSVGGDPERLIPFDIIPRILDAAEWSYLASGLKQRVRALNAFIRDVYHEREILRAGHVPEALILHVIEPRSQAQFDEEIGEGGEETATPVEVPPAPGTAEAAE